MRTRNDKKRAHLFQRGAAAVERVLGPKFPELAQHYLCPLCLVPFDESAVLEFPLALTLEHAPPKSAGFRSRAVALTCVECNGRGSKSEAHLAEYIRKLDFPRTRRLAKRRLIMSKGGVPIRALIEVDGTQARFMIPIDQNDPEQIKRFNEAPPERETMRWEVPFVYDGGLVEIAYLKAAYMAGFAQFGYRYVFGVPPLRQVRSELTRPEGAMRGFVGRWAESNEPNLRLVICPRPVPTLMAEIGMQTIALPWFGSGEDYYSKLAEVMAGANGPAVFEYSRLIDWPRGLVLKPLLGNVGRARRDGNQRSRVGEAIDGPWTPTPAIS